jgi:hypothetical protein
MKFLSIALLALSLFVVDQAAAQALSCTQKAASPLSDTVTWDKYPVAADTINILRSNVSGGPYSPVGSVSAATSAFTDTTVSLGTFYYVLNAQDTLGQKSGNSAEACITFNAVPTVPTGTKVQ